MPNAPANYLAAFAEAEVTATGVFYFPPNLAKSPELRPHRLQSSFSASRKAVHFAMNRNEFMDGSTLFIPMVRMSTLMKKTSVQRWSKGWKVEMYLTAYPKETHQANPTMWILRWDSKEEAVQMWVANP